MVRAECCTGGNGAAGLFRLAKRQYRLLETLALPGEEEASVGVFIYFCVSLC